MSCKKSANISKTQVAMPSQKKKETEYLSYYKSFLLKKYECL